MAQDVEIAQVVVGEGRRPLNVDHMKRLAESIKDTGLLQPIVVMTPGFRLVAGLHRLEACKSLGWKTIPTIQRRMTRLESDLAEIDENLMRHELTMLERGEALARRKEIYLAMHPEAAKGVAGAIARQRGSSATPTVGLASFAADVEARTGRSESAVNQDIRVAQRLTDETKAEIRGTPLEDSARRPQFVCVEIFNVNASSHLASASLSPARARAIAADLLAFADEAEPAQPDGPTLAERVTEVESRCDVNHEYVADHETRLAALEGKREVVGYRVRQADLKRYVCQHDDGWDFRSAPPVPLPKANALRLLREARQWDSLDTPHYGFRLVRVTRRVRRA